MGATRIEEAEPTTITAREEINWRWYDAKFWREA
jgi:hypothetical protein